ncbi:MAG: alpha/beta fold hydrolase [Pseudorhodoplanes sp.]|nr:alpha/beta fold hydrolase [Pseudorhodoplanes sp.]
MATVTAHDPAFALNAVRVGPKGAPVVVLVHAIGLDLTCWIPQIFALSERFDVVAYDLLGHGRSTVPLTGYDLESLAIDLAAVIRSTGSPSAHIMGLSVGGMIAQTLAIMQPELVRSLIIIDSAATFTEQARAAIRQRGETTRRGGMNAILEQTLERWFTPKFRLRRPEVVDSITKTLLRNSPDVHAAMWDAIAKLDLETCLASISCPTLVLVGENDPTTPVSASQFIAERISGAELRVIADASHMSPIEQPHVINEMVMRYL